MAHDAPEGFAGRSRDAVDKDAAIENQIQLAVIVYSVTDAAIAKLEERYKGLTIAADGFDTVKSAVKELTRLRSKLETERKAKKEDALEFGRKLDAEAKRVRGLIESIETPLRTAVDAHEAKEKLKAEAAEIAEKERLAKLNAMVEDIKTLGLTAEGRSISDLKSLQDNMRILTPTEEVFGEFTALAEEYRLAAYQRLTVALANAEAREKVAREQAAEAKRLTAEREQLARDREEIAKMRREAEERIDVAARQQREEEERKEAYARAEAHAREEAERLKQKEIDDAQRAAREEAERLVREREAFEAGQRAAEAQRKADAEAEERRRKALDDVAKINTLILDLRAVRIPELRDSRAQRLMSQFSQSLGRLVEGLVEDAERLSR